MEYSQIKLFFLFLASESRYFDPHMYLLLGGNDFLGEL